MGRKRIVEDISEEMVIGKNDFYRKGKILQRYGRWYEYIEKLPKLLQASSDIQLKDLVPDKQHQALIFREIGITNFDGSGLEYIAWLSLTHVALKLESDIEGKTILDVVEEMIQKRKELGSDFINILYLFGKRRTSFYQYLTFEMSKKSLPLEFDSAIDIVESAKASAYLSIMEEIVMCENRGKDPQEIEIFLEKIMAM
ncbi:MAG: hypothetical protein WC819_05105 [Parcubacteria group bacterium]|jgi:hypothetical protein